MHLLYFLMNAGEFTERREVIKHSLGIDKLLILCIFHDESRVLVNVIASSRGTRLLESFSKLVERREAVNLYLAHKLARFFLLSSLKYLRVPLRACALETRVPGTCGCRKLTREQALHYARVTRTRLSSCL